MNVAEKIRRITDERGVKYTAISQATHIPVDALSKSFLGKRKLLADEMLAICGFLHLDMGDLTDPALTQPPRDGESGGKGIHDAL